MFSACVLDLQHTKQKARSTFSYIKGIAGLEFTNFRLLLCFRIEILRSRSVYHLRRPRHPPSRLLQRPDSIALKDRIKRAFPLYR